MKVLVLGASGATGKLVVAQMLARKISVRALVRESAVLSAEILGNPLVETVRGNISKFNGAEAVALLRDCDVVISCLGHNITFKGLFGKPQNLVSGAVKKMCGAAGSLPDKKVKFILMSTTAYTNPRAGEKITFGEKIIFSTLYALLPPHRDNVRAADFLRDKIGTKDEKIEWVAVRPDSLLNEDQVKPYDLYPSQIRSPLFNAGVTSRINVGHFMAELLVNDKLWNEWRFRMPVVYNKA